MAALPGRGSVQGCRRACGRGMMACSALLSGSMEAEQGSEKAEREERVEREGREKRVWSRFDSKIFKISNGHVKNFQHEIC